MTDRVDNVDEELALFGVPRTGSLFDYDHEAQSPAPVAAPTPPDAATCRDMPPASPSASPPVHHIAAEKNSVLKFLEGEKKIFLEGGESSQKGGVDDQRRATAADGALTALADSSPPTTLADNSSRALAAVPLGYSYYPPLSGRPHPCPACLSPLRWIDGMGGAHCSGCDPAVRKSLVRRVEVLTWRKNGIGGSEEREREREVGEIGPDDERDGGPIDEQAATTLTEPEPAPAVAPATAPPWLLGPPVVLGLSPRWEVMVDGREVACGEGR